MPPNPVRVLLVTDVPYWNQETGAQVRIKDLINGLNVESFQTETLVTQFDPNMDLKEAGRKSEVPIHFLEQSPLPPRGFWGKINWKLKSILNWLGLLPEPTLPAVRDLQNYYSSDRSARAVQFIEKTSPDVIVFEYLTQLSILRGLPEKIRQSAVMVLDSHDVLSKRTEDFAVQGFDHWVNVSESEEKKSLEEFDLVIAIQEEEGKWFQQVVGPQRVVTTGLEMLPKSTGKREQLQESDCLSVGYLASHNPANLDAAKMVFSLARRIEGKKKIRFVIAGSVCGSDELMALADQIQPDSVEIRLQGRVNNVSDFYSNVDVVWNPIRFGTGLKVKNLEALSFGKCLVTTSHGSTGMCSDGESIDHDLEGAPFLVADGLEAAETLFKELDFGRIRTIANNGEEFLAKRYGAGTQYPLLRQRLASLLSAKSS